MIHRSRSLSNSLATAFIGPFVKSRNPQWRNVHGFSLNVSNGTKDCAIVAKEKRKNPSIKNWLTRFVGEEENVSPGEEKIEDSQCDISHLMASIIGSKRDAEMGEVR